MLPAREARWATRRKDREARNMMKGNINWSFGWFDSESRSSRGDGRKSIEAKLGRARGDGGSVRYR